MVSIIRMVILMIVLINKTNWEAAHNKIEIEGKMIVIMRMGLKTRVKSRIKRRIVIRMR